MPHVAPTLVEAARGFRAHRAEGHEAGEEEEARAVEEDRSWHTVVNGVRHTPRHLGTLRL